MAIWRWIVFDDQKTKPHAVPAGYQHVLLRDLRDRDHDTKAKITTIKEATFDEPGMVHVDRPWTGVVVAGLGIELPCECVASFLLRAKRMEIRHFAPTKSGRDRPYIKIHTWIRCLVMTPAMRDTFVEKLQGILAEAEKRAHIFYADKKQPNDILREVAARSSKVSIDRIPDLTDQHNRFIPKVRGQA